jgi:hypothetical protein
MVAADEGLAGGGSGERIVMGVNNVPTDTQQVLAIALPLPAVDRAAIVESMLASWKNV